MPIQSLYSKLQNPAKIATTRVVEQFDGDVLDERWNSISPGTAGMVDAVDEGFFIQTLGGGGSTDEINFNDIRHYDSAGCAFVAVWRPVTTTNQNVIAGLTSAPSFTSADSFSVGHQTTLDATNWNIQSGNDGTTTNLSSATATTFGFRKWKMTTDGTTVQAFLEGVLEGSITTNIPNEDMQPIFFLNGVAKEGRIRYFEAYNT